MHLDLIASPITFFTDHNFSRWTILFITAWKMLGFSTLSFSTALSSVNQDYYEAASLDGSSKLKQFFDITLPLISPTVLFMIMMTILFGGQWTFAFIDTLTQGGPYGTTTNFYYLMYEFAFNYSNVGLSAATSLVFMFFVGGLAVVLQFVREKLVFYDN
jgi:multiple sugar transport system permease protein